MALHTVGDLKEDIQGLLQGINLEKVSDLNGAIERATRTVVQRVDIPEASVTSSVVLYNGIFDYPADARIFGSAIIDLQPQGVNRTPLDSVIKRPLQEFDQTKQLIGLGNIVSFIYDKGTAIMRVATASTIARAILDPMSATTGWVAAGSASGLTLDQTVFYDAPASLRFLLTGASTGTLTKTITSQNLASYQNVGVGFLAIYNPTAANLSSIALRVGSSSSAYSSVTETQGFLGAWQSSEWTIIAFDFSGTSDTGTPNWSAITYVQVRIATTGTITNFRVGGLFISLPSPHNVIVQSAAIFNSGGTLSQSITTDSDTIILNDAAYTLLEHEAAIAVSFQQGGTVASQSIQTLNQVLHGVRARNGVMIQPGLYDQYSADNPSQQLRTVGTYYEFRF